MMTYSVIIGSPPGGSTLPSGTFGSFGCRTMSSTPAARLNMAFRFGKAGSTSKSGCMKARYSMSLHLARIGPDANWQVGNLLPECVAPCLRIADVFVQIDDE